MFIEKSQKKIIVRLRLGIVGHVQCGSYLHSTLEEGAMQSCPLNANPETDARDQITLK